MSNLTTEEIFVKLGKQLLPTGRAFKAGDGSNTELLLIALAKSKTRLHDASLSFLDSLIPDNDNFTAEDATEWELRFGLISNPLTLLADRKAAILRKMAAPGLNPAKGHYLWLQEQLQQAGFNVFVYENIFPGYPTGKVRLTPGDINTGILTPAQHGTFEHGSVQHGSYFNYIIANSMVNDEDVAQFNNVTDFGASFFIGGSTLGSYANVLGVREQEFRQLVLTQKQVQNTVFAYIDFT